MGKVVPPSGDPKSKIWWIGEAPAQTELVEGKPFVGNAGMLLRRFLMQVGIDPNDCYFDNIYNERAPQDKVNFLFKKGVPNEALSQSIERLNADIRKYRPNLIVTLGAAPTHVLTGYMNWSTEYHSFVSIMDWRGSILEHKDIPGQKIIPTFHPSYINREGYADHGIFIADLTRILHEQDFSEIRRPQKEFIVKPFGKELYDVRDRLIETGDVLTVDIEFIGRKLLCVGMTTGSDWATTIHTKSETEINICKQIIECGKPLNMQNAMFDCSVLEWHHKIEAFKNLKYDTMLAAHAINIELPKDLGFLASIYTDQPPWKHTIDWEKIKKGQQSIEDVFVYNCIDVWVQHEIMEKQIAEDFSERPDKRAVFEFEMLLINPLWEMSKRGMKIDPIALAEYRLELLKELEFESMMIMAINGGRAANVKSGDDVASMLFDYLKLRPGAKTKGGKYKTDDKTLASLLGRCETKEQKEAIKYIRSARRYRDLLSKFVNVELDEDGRTRGIYNPGGTVTGRLASKKFVPTGKGHQQQNIPRKARHIIIADDGYVFGSIDKERAESLVVSHLTNDPIMLQHHKKGADAHKLLAQLFFESDEITKDQRFIMKQTRHAGNYMEGPITFARSVNQIAHITGVSVTNKEAETFISWYRDIHVGLKPWWLNVQQTLYAKKELTNMLGRSRTFYQRVDACLPEAIAYVPQGTVGDLLNVALLNMRGYICDQARKLLPWHEEIPAMAAELDGLGFQLLNQVHDSIGFQFKRENETRIIDILMKCLEIPLKNPHTHEIFYIGDELKVGRSWGEAS